MSGAVQGGEKRNLQHTKIGMGKRNELGRGLRDWGKSNRHHNRRTSRKREKGDKGTPQQPFKKKKKSKGKAGTLGVSGEEEKLTQMLKDERGKKKKLGGRT